ncbi:uncharacterized protein PAC_11959 [Phialocephala subalpina]|uniref:Uncharacterized protein n=1 Tax=Phialocephala subalpina TaxID=576137 RepID=A0A1L7XAL8_9HELO|nr:uncharacterized protein PAC_11959 [Phialocephala subalpina]
MSSSQQPTSQPAENTPDEPMMEAPDSPPELDRVVSPTQSFASLPSGSQQPSSSSGRVNGESGAKVNFGAPGSSWQTKKFNEEYDKMESQLLDKSWEQRFGDPLLTNNVGGR